MAKNETVMPPELLVRRDAYLKAKQVYTDLGRELDVLRSRLDVFETDAKTADETLIELSQKHKDMVIEVAKGKADLADIRSLSEKITAAGQEQHNLKSIIASLKTTVDEKDRDRQRASDRYWQSRSMFLYGVAADVLSSIAPQLRIVFAAFSAAKHGNLDSDRVMREMVEVAGGITNLSAQKDLLASRYGFEA